MKTSVLLIVAGCYFMFGLGQSIASDFKKETTDYVRAAQKGDHPYLFDHDYLMQLGFKQQRFVLKRSNPLYKEYLTGWLENEKQAPLKYLSKDMSFKVLKSVKTDVPGNFYERRSGNWRIVGVQVEATYKNYKTAPVHSLRIIKKQDLYFAWDAKSKKLLEIQVAPGKDTIYWDQSEIKEPIPFLNGELTVKVLPPDLYGSNQCQATVEIDAGPYQHVDDIDAAFEFLQNDEVVEKQKVYFPSGAGGPKHSGYESRYGQGVLQGERVCSKNITYRIVSLTGRGASREKIDYVEHGLALPANESVTIAARKDGPP